VKRRGKEWGRGNGGEKGRDNLNIVPALNKSQGQELSPEINDIATSVKDRYARELEDCSPDRDQSDLRHIWADFAERVALGPFPRILEDAGPLMGPPDVRGGEGRGGEAPEQKSSDRKVRGDATYERSISVNWKTTKS